MTDQDNSYTVSKPKSTVDPEGTQFKLTAEKADEVILMLEDGEWVGELKRPSIVVE